MISSKIFSMPMNFSRLKMMCLTLSKEKRRLICMFVCRETVWFAGVIESGCGECLRFFVVGCEHGVWGDHCVCQLSAEIDGQADNMMRIKHQIDNARKVC